MARIDADSPQPTSPTGAQATEAQTAAPDADAAFRSVDGDASFDYAADTDGFGTLADPLTEPAPADAEADDAEADDADDAPEDETILIDGKAFRGSRTADPGAGSEPPEQPEAAQPLAPVAVAAAPLPAAPADPAPAPTAAATSDATELAAPAGPAPAGVRGLVAALRVPRAKATQLVIGVLCALLGFFAVVQLRLQADDNTLSTARQSDLIRILDDLNDRSDRLNGEIQDLDQRRRELESGSDRSQAALDEAQARREVLGILAGTVPARGAGITLRISDPEKKVDAAVLLDTLQELRDAGAEAVQINDVRVVASTDFLDAEPGSVLIDGREVAAPYLFTVIGDPDTLDPALRIPGGVFAVLDERGAIPTVDAKRQVEIDATRSPQDSRFARAIEPED